MSEPGPVPIGRGEPYRDGLVHVRAAHCATCLFRPGTPLRLPPGRVREVIADNVAADSALVCHETLPEWTGEPDVGAICHGFAQKHPTLPLRLAAALGLLREVD